MVNGAGVNRAYIKEAAAAALSVVKTVIYASTLTHAHFTVSPF